MIDITYPETHAEWIKLIKNVEEESDYRILCGFAGIDEITPIVVDLMSLKHESFIDATNIYLSEIANICMENKEVGKKMYLFFMNGIKEYNLETIGDMREAFDNISLKELNAEYKKDFQDYGSDFVENVEQIVEQDEDGLQDKMMAAFIKAQIAAGNFDFDR